jgi:predicted ABC-type ATPase
MPAADVVHADPDQIISRLPEYQAGGKDSAAAVHYESAYLGRVVTARALHQRLNVLVDGTGNSSAQVMAARLTEAHAAGHHVIGRYVTVPTDEAVRRARLRGQQTGRYVPEQAIRGIHASVSRVFSRLVAQGLFDEAELWDNSGPEPALIGHQDPGGKWVVTGHEAWRRFLAKGTGRG